MGCHNAKLAQAGIRLWVLTGDKLETAINIGFACNLLHQGMTQLIISLDDDWMKEMEASSNKTQSSEVFQNSVKEQIQLSQQKRNSDPQNEAFALIIDGKALTYALDRDMEKDFIELSLTCSSVICCRVSPKQKALVARLVKHSKGSITLGIGDGANDVDMIQEADVGVGITGVEGMQATMASDFSIAQFRYLERLLLVHGSWNYKRIAYMVCYFLYKNIHFGFSIFYYEAYAAFSGQALYDEWYLAFYNVFFTSLPVIAYGIFEQDLPAILKIHFPGFYHEGIQNVHFSWTRILGWMANGMLSSAIVFFLTVNAAKKQALHKDGQVIFMEALGTSLYTSIVWTVNCQLLLFSRYITWVHHLCIWGSIALWLLFVIVYGFLTPTISKEAYRAFVEVCAPSVMLWLVMVLASVAALLPSFIYKTFKSILCPAQEDLIRHKGSLLQVDQEGMALSCRADGK